MQKNRKIQPISIKTSPGIMTLKVKLADKGIKMVIMTLFQMFKKPE